MGARDTFDFGLPRQQVVGVFDEGTEEQVERGILVVHYLGVIISGWQRRKMG